MDEEETDWLKGEQAWGQREKHKQSYGVRNSMLCPATVNTFLCLLLQYMGKDNMEDEAGPGNLDSVLQGTYKGRFGH